MGQSLQEETEMPTVDQFKNWMYLSKENEKN